MKKLFNTLRLSGRIDIQVDYHKMFGETATQAIEAKPFEYAEFDTDAMKAQDCIIRVEFFPSDKPMSPPVAYGVDLEYCLRTVYKEYQKWRPSK